MTAFGQSNFLQALGWAVLNSLWQMALLWVVYQLITAIFKVKSSSHRSSLSTLLLFSGFAWFVFTFLIILSDRPMTGGYPFMNMDSSNSVSDWLQSSLPVASILYLALLILPILNFIRNYRYVHVIRKYGMSKADVQLRMFVQRVAAQMGIRKPVQIWMSEFVSSPLTIGFLKPIILLPVAAINNLTTQQIEAVLLHELSHIRRFDYLINLITRAIQTILYFNPFVKAFAKIIEREREKNCDEKVIQFQYEPYGYASALLELEKVASLPQRSLAVAAASSKKNELLGRIESILGVNKKQGFSFNQLASVMAGLLCFIGINTILLLSRPTVKATAAVDLVLQMTSPSSEFSEDKDAKATEELKRTTILNSVSAEGKSNITSDGIGISSSTATISEPEDRDLPINNSEASLLTSLVNVALKENIIPELNSHEEVQVKDAIKASRKVIEEVKWKDMEQSIADAMTMTQKIAVKNAYEKAMNKADWDKMGDKLRLAYDQINWNEVNAGLNKALAEIKLDSIQQVYSMALTELAGLQKELAAHDEKGVPDSDITLKMVEERKAALQKATSIIRNVKKRKIVDL